MSWYDEDFLQRRPITVVNTTGEADNDVVVTIPEDWDEFWETIDDDGYELRVTGPDGYTLLDYEVEDGSAGPFDKAGRAGQLRIDSAPLKNTAATVCVLWLYFDSTGAADASTSPSIADTILGRIELAQPPARAITYRPAAPGDTEPPREIAKTPGETRAIWLDVTGALEPYRDEVGGSLRYEEVWYVLVDSVDEEGDAASIDQFASVRFVETAVDDGHRFYLVCPVAGGTDGVNYTLSAAFATRVPGSSEARRVHEPTVAVLVRQPVEPAP